MNEWDALSFLSDELGTSDDAAVVGWGDTNALLTTDMLHESTDLPDGVEPRVVGWRVAAVSLSDVAAMGGEPLAVVIALGTPEFDRDYLEEFVEGANAVCADTGARYVGGDLDRHDEATFVSTVLGESESPVSRSGSEVGDRVCVTGELGRTAVALRLFDEGEHERANRLFAFTPRVAEGTRLAEHATSMMDVSDGLAVSLHQMSEASGNGFEVSQPPAVEGARGVEDTVFTGGDYELVFTLPPGVEPDVDFTVIGECVESGVRLDGDEIEKRGYVH